MASAFTHVAFACALTFVARPVGKASNFYALASLCSVAPDFDVVGFHFGIEYEDALGHRGLSHSLLVALATGMFVALAMFRGATTATSERVRAGVIITLATASHGLLDAMTNGGLGIGFFLPFDTGRYFLPWTPIEVSPIGIAAFFSAWGARVLASELLVVWLPCGLTCAVVATFRRCFGAV